MTIILWIVRCDIATICRYRLSHEVLKGVDTPIVDSNVPAGIENEIISSRRRFVDPDEKPTAREPVQEHNVVASIGGKPRDVHIALFGIPGPKDILVRPAQPLCSCVD